jgi:hypothetical protein
MVLETIELPGITQIFHYRSQVVTPGAEAKKHQRVATAFSPIL